jgi:hypothetical protein
MAYDESVRAAGMVSTLLLLVSTPCLAEPLTVGFLPSRRPDLSARRDRLVRLAAALGGQAATPPLALAPLTTRADELSATGRLDEAAALYDLAVEQGVRAPLAVADPAVLVHALVARASIGLARGETDAAQALLEQLLRWDPTATLTPEEDAPRMQAAWQKARAAAGALPALRREDLGADCARLLIARPLDHERAELRRVEGCRAGAPLVMAPDGSDRALEAALGAPASPPRVRPAHKRAWLWVTVALASAVAVAGAGVGIWAATRGADSSTWNVTPRF